MNIKKLFHAEQDDDVALPEYHSDEFDEMQQMADDEDNEEMVKEDIVYDTVAIPEIHYHPKKKKKKTNT